MISHIWTKYGAICLKSLEALIVRWWQLPERELWVRKPHLEIVPENQARDELTWSSHLWSCLQKSMSYFSAWLQMAAPAFCYLWLSVIANSHRRIYFWSIVVYAVMQIVSRQLTKHACGLGGIPLWGRQWEKCQPTKCHTLRMTLKWTKEQDSAVYWVLDTDPLF